MERSLYFYEKNSPRFYFLGIFLLLTRRMESSSAFFDFIPIDLE